MMNVFVRDTHGSQSRSRPPTRRALRRIGVGDSDQSGDTRKTLHRKLKKFWKNHDKF